MWLIFTNCGDILDCVRKSNLEEPEACILFWPLMTMGHLTNLLSTLASWPSIDTNDDNDVTLVWHTVSMYLLSVHYQLQHSVMQPLQNTSGVMNDNWHSLLWLANIGDDIHIWKLLKLLFYTFTYNCALANDFWREELRNLWIQAVC